MPEPDGTAGDSRGADSDADPSVSVPRQADVPGPDEVTGQDDATGYVVWHRKHLRTDDHRALAQAVADGDVVCPLFVFDPTFYGADSMACDARIRFLHEAVTSLDTLYGATAGKSVRQEATASRASLADKTPLTVGRPGPAAHDDPESPLQPPETPGLTVGYGDPVAVLSRFVERGWSVLTMATPTSRYGKRRDDRVREACGDAVTFVSGDGLVRDAEWPRKNWQSRIEEWLTGAQHGPGWHDGDTCRFVLDTGVTPAAVDEGHEIRPTKSKVPTGTHRVATTRLREFVDRIGSYPGNISAPQDARGGTSGLSPFINFGLLSVRQVYQYVQANAPDCRGREMYTSRLVWNMHYNQKLVDWPGWTETAVNPVFEGRNEDTHDPALVAAWKQGKTGFPMVDASMRCLRGTGWLNFRMRAMCASVFTHILGQPWWIGADWYHHHLVDSDVGINYTQWQSQAGLVGKPSQRVYNPRKQVRDHDPDGEWLTEWVPELSGLPSEFLDRPERTPLAVQEECGVRVGEDYPRPVVDFEARREAFWTDHERRQPAAARELGRPEIAKRASFSGGLGAARAIADEYGDGDGDDGTQASLADIDGADATGNGSDARPDREGRPSEPTPGREGDSGAGEATVPTGTGQRAGEPSPDDSAAVADGLDSGDESGSDDGSCGHGDAEQTTMGQFE